MLPQLQHCQRRLGLPGHRGPFSSYGEEQLICPTGQWPCHRTALGYKFHGQQSLLVCSYRRDVLQLVPVKTLDACSAYRLRWHMRPYFSVHFLAILPLYRAHRSMHYGYAVLASTQIYVGTCIHTLQFISENFPIPRAHKRCIMAITFLLVRYVRLNPTNAVYTTTQPPGDAHVPARSELCQQRSEPVCAGPRAANPSGRHL